MADAMAVRMVNAIARTIPSFGAMCPLLVSRLSDFYGGIIGGMCELLHTSAVVQKMQGGVAKLVEVRIIFVALGRGAPVPIVG